MPPTTVHLTVTLFLLACTEVGPDYVPATMSLPVAFADAPTQVALADVAADRWWTNLDDRLLNDLVDQGLGSNLDLKAARALIAAADAGVRATGLADGVTGDLAADTIRSGADGRPTATTVSASLSGSFVLDLFGGQRRATQAAIADRDAAFADEEAIRLAYQSGIVGAYLDARYFQEVAALTRLTIAAREETAALVSQQVAVGDASELDATRARADIEQARAALPAAQDGYRQAIYRMATLLAVPADDVDARLAQGRAQPAAGMGAAGLPADLLRNRPDIRAAERRVASAVASLGVAEAALYPSFTLTGNVTAGDTESWSFGPAISLALLNQPVLQARRDQAVAAATEAEVAWRKAVLDGIADVQAQLSSLARAQDEIAAYDRLVAAKTRQRELAEVSYEVGASTLLDLLEAERDQTAARQSRAGAARDAAVAWSALQVALGKGARVSP